MTERLSSQPQPLFWIGSKMNHVEQKLINEIVALLIKEDLHTRAIADQLRSNHATVLRKLRDLTEDNIVDFRMEGKNKVFHFKRTIEGRNAAMIAEIYNQSSIVSKYPVLRGIFQAIQEMPEIPLAILYGSYVKGLATKGSDIDIYIETSDSLKKKQLEQRHSLLSVKIGAFDTKDLLIREMMKDHIIIKGVEVYYEKTGFFEKTP
jgi:predicted nucleotidyltransferase